MDYFRDTQPNLLRFSKKIEILGLVLYSETVEGYR